MADSCDDDQRELVSAMRECVKAMQSQAALVVRRRYEERPSCRSIAESLDRTVTWVTSTLSRSRRALRACIESRLGDGIRTIVKLPEDLFVDDKVGKPVGIYQHGRRSIHFGARPVGG